MARHARPAGSASPEKRSEPQERQAVKMQKPGAARRKTIPSGTVMPHECLIIGDQGSCPEWQELLVNYPMIDSVQREDFPAHGASFVYLAHFYRTKDKVRESACAQEQFKNFFHIIGYQFDSAMNFKSRWYEGIGVRLK